MPILNYRKEFAPLVESGEKRLTIRAMRKRPFKSGDRLFHYTGLRTKACRKLLESTCLFADRIDIIPHGTVFINNWLCDGPMKNLAVADAAGMGGPFNRFDRALNRVVFDDELDFHLGKKIDDIFSAAIKFRMPLLTAEAADIGDSHSL